MLHDVVIVGAGPVGSTLALALAAGDVEVTLLDARPAGQVARGDRSLALSHGARLILEKVGVWDALSAIPGALTPITRIDISQAGGFGQTQLAADEHGVAALGYVVSYRALQAALDAALGRSSVSMRHGVTATAVRGGPAHATVETAGEGSDAIVAPVYARLAAVADGTGDAMAFAARQRHDYRQVALVAKLECASPRPPYAAAPRTRPSRQRARAPPQTSRRSLRVWRQWPMAPAMG